jgi:O-antigen ligase
MSLVAIKDSFPVGTGLGTFSSIYRRHEDPQQAAREYTNRAHNDYLELALEAGMVGALVILLFIAWWGKRSIEAWRSDAKGGQMARSGSVIVGVILLHSLVDYPVRMAAIAAVFAVGCAFLVPHLRRSAPSRAADTGPREALKHLEAEA